MHYIHIADPEEIRKRVRSLKNRSEDIKARVAPTLKSLWFSERLHKSIESTINFEELLQSFPHFEEVIKFYKNQILISKKLNIPFKSAPVLLLGDPGLGKTYFANKLAKLIGLPFYEISMATMTAGFELAGSSLQWGEGTVGFIAQSLVNSNVANPIILVDEIDKSSGSNRYNPLSVFYPILEPHSAKRFKDEALNIELDASHVIWIATANNQVDIKGPILSRMKVFTIKQPCKLKMAGVINSIYKSVLKNNCLHQLLSHEIPHKVIDKLSTLTPREVRLALEESAVAAVMKDHREVSIDDIPSNIRMEVARVGFIK